jgi:hypothetical protein
VDAKRHGLQRSIRDQTRCREDASLALFVPGVRSKKCKMAPM